MTLPVPELCPKCGAPMVLRRTKRGAHIGKYFWGCNRFPKCLGSMVYTGPIPVEPPVEPKKIVFKEPEKLCPKCGKPMHNKKRSSYWICRGYPACNTKIPIFSDEQLATKTQIRSILTKLTDRDQKIMTLRFGIDCDPHTMADIGKTLTLSRERVRQLVNKVLRKVNHLVRKKQ